jgi:murein DD-endopeptidase MepM/ murein hydrolase activator NlpD
MREFPKLPDFKNLKNLSVEDARKAARKHLRTRRGLVSAGLAASILVGGGGAAVAATLHGGQDTATTASAQAADSGAEQAPDKGSDQAAKPAPAKPAPAKPQPKQTQQAKPAPKPAPAKPSPSDWTLPVHKPYRLTAGFGKSGDRWSHNHTGQDFAVNSGTEVDTVHTGTVVKAGWGGAYGNRIVIEHAPGEYSEYAHLSKIDVSVGQHVTTGQEIGLSGATGNVTGPHLHFEIRTTPNYGSGIDPMPFLKAHGLKP